MSLYAGPAQNRPRSVSKSNWGVVYKPFSSKYPAPKIPDGSTSLSTGQKLQFINSFNCPTDRPLVYCIFPGLGCCGVVFNGAQAYHFNFTDKHGCWEKTASGLDQSDNLIAKWRMVSSGVKFTLTNNADENDGWFECVRAQVAHDPKTWTLVNALDGSAPINGSPVVLRPVMAGDTPLGIDLNTMIDHPSYRTGKLRDIHKYQFNLSPNGTNHDFIRVRESYKVATLDESADSGDILKDLVDDNYDCLIIRIHGRSVTGESQTNILTHVVSNQEVVYENGTTLARFHTEGHKAGYISRSGRRQYTGAYSRRTYRRRTGVPQRRVYGRRLGMRRR